MSIQPFQYNSPTLNYKYTSNCFTESYHRGVIKLSRKPKTEANDYACLTLVCPLKRGINYTLTVSFKIKTASHHIDFCLLSGDRKRIQKIGEYSISKDDARRWTSFSVNFKPNADGYIYFGFRGGLLYGLGNFIMIDALHIYESADSSPRMSAQFDSLKKLINDNYKREQFIHWNEMKAEGETSLDAKKRFFMSLKTEDEIMLALQKSLTVLLEEFGRICRENDIDYWLDFGTLLGAVRHGGFIPWDDDIDVGMIRKDVDKLEKVLKNCDTFIKLDKYYCIDRDTCNIVRIVFKEENIKAFVDIFLYDFVDSSDPAATTAKQREIRAHFSDDMLKYKCVNNDPTLSYWENRRIFDKDTIALIDGEVARLNDELGVTADKGSHIMWSIDNVSVYAEKPGCVVPYDRVFPLKKLVFDGVEYSAPNDWETKLFERYGDIYTFPANMNHSHVPRTDEQFQKFLFIVNKYYKK